MSEDAVTEGEERDAAPRIVMDVRRGAPTPEELGAVMAVLTEAYEQEAAAALAETEPRPSAWQVSARLLREPLRREIGWGRFSG